MKLLQLSVFLFFTILNITACDSSDEPENMLSVELGDEINIKFGEAARINETEISVNFLSVVEDSRCPEGVDCFWEGRGVVQLEVNEADNTIIELIERAGHPDLAVVTLGNYVYTILELSPYPKEGEEITDEDYEIRLTVAEL